MTSHGEDRLFYFGTSEEVRLGDRIAMKRLLRKPVHGTVVYMPGVSPVHPEMEWPEFSRWAIEFEDGTLLAWPYTPDTLQPDKRIILLERGSPDYKGLQPDEELG